MTFCVEMIVNIRMDRREFLKRLHLSEAELYPLFPAERKVGIFSTIVQPPPHFPAIFDAQLLERCWVGA